MARCSWLTKVDDEEDLELFKAAIQHNPAAYGIDYVIDLTTPVPKLGTGLVVAWSGDEDYSLRHYMPNKYLPALRTLPLEEVVASCPDWCDSQGPAKYGRLLYGHEVMGGAGAEQWDQDAWLRWLAKNPDVAAKVVQWDTSA
jgi:hypothetical protein